MIAPQIILKGLSDIQVTQSREKCGNNSMEMHEDRVLWRVLRLVVFEPMFILLLAACIIYFFVGQYLNGIIMLVSIFIVAGISLYQEYKSQNAIQALKKLSAPLSNVLRNGVVTKIPAAEIVIDDILLLEEGEIISADGLLLDVHDLSINESILTGESFAVNKTAENNTP